MKFSSKKVLIVEDDLLLSMVEKRMVQKLGHEVLAVTDNGHDAIKEVKKQRPDLIITDMRLRGDLDGLDTIREIHQLYPMPVIYVTGTSYSEHFDQAEKMSFSCFLQKPLEMAALKHAFQSIFKNEMVIQPEDKKPQPAGQKIVPPL